MYDRQVCGIDLGLCERHDCIHFTCPQCDAKHDRGYFGGPMAEGGGTFRCLHCGYSGHGLHPDAEVDRGVYRDWALGNAELA